MYRDSLLKTKKVYYKDEHETNDHNISFCEKYTY